MKGKRKITIIIGVLFISMMLFSGVAFAAKKVIHVWHTETNPKSRAAIANIVSRFEKLNPDIKIFEVSARTGEGFGEWAGWLSREAKRFLAG